MSTTWIYSATVAYHSVLELNRTSLEDATMCAADVARTVLGRDLTNSEVSTLDTILTTADVRARLARNIDGVG